MDEAVEAVDEPGVPRLLTAPMRLRNSWKWFPGTISSSSAKDSIPHFFQLTIFFAMKDCTALLEVIFLEGMKCWWVDVAFDSTQHHTEAFMNQNLYHQRLPPSRDPGFLSVPSKSKVLAN